LNEKRVQLLKSAGCHAVKCGVESGDQGLRNSVLGKNLPDSAIAKGALLLKKHKIKLQTFNITGIPGESMAQAFTTYRMNQLIKPDFLWCSLMNPYPGTKIYEDAQLKGYIDKDFDFKDSFNSFFSHTPFLINNRMEKENLQKLMYTGLLLSVPEKMMAFLIKLKLSPFYSLVFNIAMLIGLKRINKAGFLEIIRAGVFYLKNSSLTR
jgi:radical SAM superfamily enzyme YgiQ (UPF0313 family)